MVVFLSHSFTSQYSTILPRSSVKGIVLRGSMLTSDSTNYVMLMTFHCFLLICDSHSRSLLILQKALKENGSCGSSLLASLSTIRGECEVYRRLLNEAWGLKRWPDDRRGNQFIFLQWVFGSCHLGLHCSSGCVVVPRNIQCVRPTIAMAFWSRHIPLTYSPWGIPSFFFGNW